MEAFKVTTYQIAGPAWLDEDCFEIIAKMPEGATSDQIPAMLQALLVERFKLAAHKEDRPRPIYALVPDKGGVKFKEANLSFRRMGPRPGDVMFGSTADTQRFKGAMTVARVVHFLSGRLDRPVQDFTGLNGTYDIDLSWTPDPGIDRQRPRRPRTLRRQPLGRHEKRPSRRPRRYPLNAIRASLGLKLEARTAPVEMLVIDHVERVPTGN